MATNEVFAGVTFPEWEAGEIGPMRVDLASISQTGVDVGGAFTAEDDHTELTPRMNLRHGWQVIQTMGALPSFVSAWQRGQRTFGLRLGILVLGFMVLPLFGRNHRLNRLSGVVVGNDPVDVRFWFFGESDDHSAASETLERRGDVG